MTSDRLQEIHDQMDNLQSDIKSIEQQLGNRNKTDENGNRLSGFAYWEWRNRATSALQHKNTEYQELKRQCRDLDAALYTGNGYRREQMEMVLPSVTVNGTSHHQTKPSVTWRRIGPDEARRLLEHNLHNRPIRPTRVERYARDMTEGRWQEFNGDSIAIDWDGNLTDGQQRLSAIVESGCTFWCLVIEGVDPKTYSTKDIGEPRRTKDFLVRQGSSIPTLHGAIIGHLYRWDTRHTFVKKGGDTPSIAQQLLYWSEHQAEIEPVSAITGHRGMRKIGRAGLMGALCVLFNRIDPVEAEAFFSHLGSGADLSTTNPILVLRNRLLEKRLDVGQEDAYRAAITIKAWNVWRRGDTCKVLIWRRGGVTPEPFPQPI